MKHPSIKHLCVSVHSSLCGSSGRQGSAEGRVGQDSDRPKLHELGCGPAAARSTRSTLLHSMTH